MSSLLETSLKDEQIRLCWDTDRTQALKFAKNMQKAAHAGPKMLVTINDWAVLDSYKDEE